MSVFFPKVNKNVLPMMLTAWVIAGPLDSQHKCTSQSYCVTVRSRTGLVQRSCDGNSVAQISLCAPNLSRRWIANPDYIYRSNGTSSIRRSSHTSLSSNHFIYCFSGGELGEVCCCSTDFCNGYGSAVRWMAILLILMLFFE
ncbi:unnamed protein product [Angiostrongylus costaricensis]|uniref:Activin_recp domain-containing protein n=1 Tax=Angiostrongylus costaricensis TaxID=334426 RepID=A0A0R3PM61_ANGCS|nr:unnamed protein product [Angiostrongylus costaricensis]